MKGGKSLKVLFGNWLLHGMIPNIIQGEYPRFENYMYRCFSGALTCFHRYFKKKLQNWADILDGCEQAIILFVSTFVVVVDYFVKSPTTYLFLTSYSYSGMGMQKSSNIDLVAEYRSNETQIYGISFDVNEQSQIIWVRVWL